jgi:cytochrome c oxidase subunit 3
MAALEENFQSSSIGSRYRIGMWVLLASIAMLFTSLSSAYIVRAGSAGDWFRLAMPRAVLVSTALILISSGAFQMAKRKMNADLPSAFFRWLLVTGVFGVLFVGSQILAWKQLAAQGIFLTSNPHSSFFYLLTATHAVHVIGGLLAVAFLLIRSQGKRVISERRRAATDAVAIYWHFMDALWIYLFLLLFLWR